MEGLQMQASSASPVFGTKAAQFSAGMRNVSRRYLLWAGTGLAASPVARPESNTELLYRFVTNECHIRMTVEYHDAYSSNGFWFDNRSGHRSFCLSSSGTEGRNCLPAFFGSVAVARYHLRPRSGVSSVVAIRECVRTVDNDSRLSIRPPFERTIELERGLATDIQAFGFQPQGALPLREALRPNEPWCLLRQDLYLENQSTPFLVIHWRHSVHAIRLLDVIPGEKTWPVK